MAELKVCRWGGVFDGIVYFTGAGGHEVVLVFHFLFHFKVKVGGALVGCRRKGDFVCCSCFGIDSVKATVGLAPAPEVGFVEFAVLLGLLTVEPFGFVAYCAGSFAAVAEGSKIVLDARFYFCAG